MTLTFTQIALYPRDPQRAKEFLAELGAETWIDDEVRASGKVRSWTADNTAQLSFNYELMKHPMELEILHYTKGDHWIGDLDNLVSHIGCHCSEEELERYKTFMKERGIAIVQEVMTQTHTNAYLISTGRRYHYCIFGTRHILGVDLKFIVRIENTNETI